MLLVKVVSDALAVSYVNMLLTYIESLLPKDAVNTTPMSKLYTPSNKAVTDDPLKLIAEPWLDTAVKGISVTFTVID